MCEFDSLSMRLCERCVVSMRFYAFRMVCTWRRRPTDDEWTSMPNKFSDSNAPFQHQAFDKNHHTFVPHNSHICICTIEHSHFHVFSTYPFILRNWWFGLFFFSCYYSSVSFFTQIFFLASSSTLLERRFDINIDMTERPQHRTLKCKWS